jgi:hypothetical protein
VKRSADLSFGVVKFNSKEVTVIPTKTLSYNYNLDGDLISVSIQTPASFPAINQFLLEKLVKNIGYLRYDNENASYRIIIDYTYFQENQDLVASKLKSHLSNIFRPNVAGKRLSIKMRMDEFLVACLHPSKADSPETIKRWAAVMEKVRKNYLFSKTLWIPILIELYLEMAQLPTSKIRPVLPETDYA